MKIKKKSLQFFLLLLLCSSSYAQDYISLSIHQDLKLLAFGDDLGNKAGTVDLLTRVKYQFKQKRYGYLVLKADFEKAFINNNYTRYGVGAGYTLNSFFSNDLNLEVTPYFGLGTISRDDANTFSYSGALELGYRLGERIKISAFLQFTDRTDLQRMYDDRALRYSFFLGLEFNLFKLGS